MDEWDQIEDPEITPHTKKEHLIFDKEAKTVNGKKKAFSTNSAGIAGCQHEEYCK